jgi:hypothetical protein
MAATNDRNPGSDRNDAFALSATFAATAANEGRARYGMPARPRYLELDLRTLGLEMSQILAMFDPARQVFTGLIRPTERSSSVWLVATCSAASGSM